VYYEVDCFWFLKNPYIPLDVSDPTMAMESQNDLVGDGSQERQEAVGKYEAVHDKEELTEDDKKDITNFFSLLCQNINKERQRLGGDWAVAGFVNNKRERDCLKSFLGDKLRIVVLKPTQTILKERLAKRHGSDEETLNYLMKYVQKTEVIEGEENVVTVNIEENMNQTEVMNQILKVTD